jgi:hypothetical protein
VTDEKTRMTGINTDIFTANTKAVEDAVTVAADAFAASTKANTAGPGG